MNGMYPEIILYVPHIMEIRIHVAFKPRDLFLEIYIGNTVELTELRARSFLIVSSKCILLT